MDFNIRHDVYFHQAPDLMQLLGRINTGVINLTRKVTAMNQDVQALSVKVDALVELGDAVVTELGELRDALANAVLNNDMQPVRDATAKIDALMGRMLKAAMDADVTPDTPVPGAPPKEPVPPAAQTPAGDGTTQTTPPGNGF